MTMMLKAPLMATMVEAPVIAVIARVPILTASMRLPGIAAVSSPTLHLLQVCIGQFEGINRIFAVYSKFAFARVHFHASVPFACYWTGIH